MDREMMKYGSRLAAALLPCLVLAIIWLFGIAPVFGAFGELAATRDSLATLISAEERDAASTPTLHAALLAAQSRQAEMAGLRQEPSEALAQAGLQNDLQTIVTALGGQTLSVQPLPSAIQGGVQMISLQANLMLPAGALGDLLRLVEERQPFMFITAASVQSADAQLGDPSATGSLTLTCTISAYRHI